jgi:AraC-like DNA-binding protein
MLPKQINGAGAITKIVDAEVTCPLSPGLVEFRAYAHDSGQDCLILGCAAVAVTCGHELEFFRDLRRPLVECVGGDGQSPALFANMLAELTGASIGTKAMVNTMMKQLLILLLRNHVERDGLQSSFCANLLNPQLSKALMIMLSRPQDHHCLDELAQTAGLSRSRFVQQFTEAYGTSPMDYLQSVRIRAGAKLLRQSSLPVKSIAGAVGFASRSHFSRAFRARLGVDPTAFRDAIDAPVDVELD